MMKFVNIETRLCPETINQNLNDIRELKDNYLQCCIEGTSPADDPEDMLSILRKMAAIDDHLLTLTKVIYNAEAKANGLAIPFPEN